MAFLLFSILLAQAERFAVWYIFIYLTDYILK